MPLLQPGGPELPSKPSAVSSRASGPPARLGQPRPLLPAPGSHLVMGREGRSWVPLWAGCHKSAQSPLSLASRRASSALAWEHLGPGLGGNTGGRAGTWQPPLKAGGPRRSRRCRQGPSAGADEAHPGPGPAAQAASGLGRSWLSVVHSVFSSPGEHQVSWCCTRRP